MKKQVVLYGFYPVKPGTTKSIYEMCKVLDAYPRDEYEIVFITARKTDKPAKNVEELSGLKIDKTISLYDNWNRVYNKTYSTWREAQEDFDLTKKLTNPTHFILMGGLYIDPFTIKKNKLNNVLDTSALMRFQAFGYKLFLVLSLAKACRDYDGNFIEFIYDPMENNLIQAPEIKPDKYTLASFHEFDHETENVRIKRLDALQYYLKTEAETVDLFDVGPTPEKKYRLTFGMTAVTPQRMALYEKIVPSLDMFDNFYLDHRKLKIDTSLPRDAYLEKISQSKYTLIAAGFNETTYSFSTLRFMESVWLDCLPLVGSDNMVDDFLSTFKIDRNIFDELLVDYGDIKFPTDVRRRELLEYLKGQLFPEQLCLDVLGI